LGSFCTGVRACVWLFVAPFGAMWRGAAPAVASFGAPTWLPVMALMAHPGCSVGRAMGSFRGGDFRAQRQPLTRSVVKEPMRRAQQKTPQQAAEYRPLLL
jgi:hypothetical protein